MFNAACTLLSMGSHISTQYILKLKFLIYWKKIFRILVMWKDQESTQISHPEVLQLPWYFSEYKQHYLHGSPFHKINGPAGYH